MNVKPIPESFCNNLLILLRCVPACFYFPTRPAILNTCSVWLMIPQRFPMPNCTMKQSQWGHNFIQHRVCQSVCECAWRLLASHACLPDCYCTMKRLQRGTFSQPHSLALFKKNLVWPCYGIKFGFYFLYTSL